MYINICKIIFSRKLQLKTRFFMKCLGKLKIQPKNETSIWKIYLLLKYIMDIVMAVGASMIIGERYARLSVTLILLCSVISKIVEGMGEYRSTFLFPFEALLPMALAKEKKIYGTQLVVTLGYNLLLDDLFVISAVYFLLKFPGDLLGVLVVVDLVVLNIVGFVLGNLLAGKYVYAVLINKISILRILQYILNSCAISGICVGIIAVIRSSVYENLYKKFQTIEQLLDDAYVENVFQGAVRDIVDFWSNCFSQLEKMEFLLWGSALFVLMGLLIIFILSREINLIPVDGKLQIFHQRDLYYLYCRVWERLANKIHDLFLVSQIRLFLKYRYLFVKNFFQLVCLDYECVAYIAIFSALAGCIQDKILLFQLLICANIMVMATQCSELRSGAYAYFALSPETDKLALIKMSLASPDILWKAKEKAFYGMTVIPVLIMLIYDVGYVWVFQLPLLQLVMAMLVLAGSFYLMPQIQLHMVPMVTNTEYLGETQIGESLEEDEIANKMQEFPRIFLVVIPSLLGVFMLFIPRIRQEAVIDTELLYMVITGLIFCPYLRKIRNRGVENLFHKIK